MLGSIGEALENQDYVVIIDASMHMERQVCGVSAGKAELVALSTANTAALAGFSGKKYIAWQEGVEPAERAAKERGEGERRLSFF